MSDNNILIVLSAADTWIRADGTEYPTGYWAEEFVVIHQRFVEAGAHVNVATPGGQKPTADPHSLDPNGVAGPAALEHAAYLQSISETLDPPLNLSEADIADYDAVVVPGGHGPVVDLYKDPSMGRLLSAADDAGKVIGVVCHGQAALLSANDPDGTWRFAGRRMTAFSDEEEVEFGTADNAPWLLAKRLREYGARYEKGTNNWEPFIVRDGRLISGQNPASSGPMADAVIAALRSNERSTDRATTRP